LGSTYNGYTFFKKLQEKFKKSFNHGKNKIKATPALEKLGEIAKRWIIEKLDEAP
jgi:hypothetical protein